MAKKRKKQKSTIIFPIAAIFLVFVFIYMLTPKIYTKIKSANYDENINALKTALSSSEDVQTVINRYAVENNAYVQLQNKQDHSKNIETPVLASVSTITKSFDTTLKDGSTVSLQIHYANQEMQVLNQVLMLVLPIFAIILILLMYLFYTLNHKVKKDDFEQFRKITNEMLKLTPDARIPTKDTDKTKNAAARNINELYDQLRTALDSLKNTMNESKVLETQTAASLTDIGQKINQPIEEIKTLVNGMILNEGPYRNHHIYLIEAKMKLEDLQNNLQNQLTTNPQGQAASVNQPISVQNFFKKIIQPYTLLALEKRVGFRYKFESDFQTIMNEFMFSKAFGHLMNFILKQCQTQSNIVIAQNHYDIIIAYKGDALTPSSIKQIKEIDIDIKNLFQIIQSIGLYLDFETTQKKDGMQFVFHF